MSWAEANQRPWIAVSWPRRQAGICLLFVLWEEEGKDGWTREKTVAGAVSSAVGWAPALSGPSENPATLLTWRVEERSRRGVIGKNQPVLDLIADPAGPFLSHLLLV